MRSLDSVDSETTDPALESNGDGDTKPDFEHDEDGSGITTIFCYEQLKTKSENPVEGINYKRREVATCCMFHAFKTLIKYHNFLSQAYLSDEEFERVLGMTKEAFYKLPKWKQDMNKKKADLF